MVSDTQSDDRRTVILALDDTINPKTGKRIFGCASFFDHAAKTNQSKYLRSQNVVSIGLLKIVKGRWTCCHYWRFVSHMEKTMRPRRLGLRARYHRFKPSLSRSLKCCRKFLLLFLPSHCWSLPIAGLETMACLNRCAKPLDSGHMLSRLRINTTLFVLATGTPKTSARPIQKVWRQMGNATTLANEFHERATTYSVTPTGNNAMFMALTTS